MLYGWNERKSYYQRRESVLQGRVWHSTMQKFQHSLCSYASSKWGSILKYQKVVKAWKGHCTLSYCMFIIYLNMKSTWTTPRQTHSTGEARIHIYHNIFHAFFNPFIKKSPHPLLYLHFINTLVFFFTSAKQTYLWQRH